METLAALVAKDDIGSILQLVLVAVFFVLVPIVRSITEAKKKQAAEAARRDAQRTGAGGALGPPPEPPGAPTILWEQLLRGEVEERPAIPPEPVARAAPRPPRATPGEFAGMAEPEGSASERVLTESASLEGAPIPSREEADSPYERTRPTQPQTAERLSSLEAPGSPTTQEAFGSFERLRSISERGGEVATPPPSEPSGLGRLSDEAQGMRSVAAAVRRARLLRIAQKNQDWRTALVLSEALAPPLALRAGPTWPGVPPGLA
jgi:hypothetical protein